LQCIFWPSVPQSTEAIVQMRLAANMLSLKLVLELLAEMSAVTAAIL